MDLRCAVSLPRGIALRWMVILSSTGFTGCGNSASFHSERSEESLPIENKRPRGILRANSALRMTVFRFFPQPVNPVPERVVAAALKSLCENSLRGRFCSVGLQADIVDASTCPPEGGRYIFQNPALTRTLKPGPPSRIKIPRAGRGIRGFVVQRVGAASMGGVIDEQGA